MQKALSREGGGGMSWARAIILATGIFFLAIIYTGQIPAFFSLAYTQAQLHTASQATLTLGLLAGGLALIALTASFLYDPKPVWGIIPPIFGLLGLGLTALGAGGIAFVTFTGHQFFPDQTVVNGASGTQTINWPDPSHGWFLNPYWFQPQSVDIGAVGFVLLFTGLGILGYVALYALHSRGRLTPVATTFITRFAVGAAGALVLAYLTVYTFSAGATIKSFFWSSLENVILAAALGLALFALQTWLLPVMTAPGNRQRFMPSLYLHAVQLLASVAVPLILIWVVLYPVANWMYSVHLANDYWVQCAVKTDIPDSCTFTPYIGYIIAALVSGMFFTFLIAAGYLWNRKPAFVRLGMVFGFVYAALAVVATHDTADPTHPGQLPISLALGVGIAVLAVVWTISTQREFVPAEARAVQLGCTGQWLVMGTLMAIYIGGFGLFSFPQFFDTEQNLIIQQGGNALHDAYWVLLICGALAAIQFAFLVRRDPLGNVRKFALWMIFIGAAMQIAASVHFDLSLNPFPSAGGNPVNWAFYFGVVIEVFGILAAMWGAFQTKAYGLLFGTLASAAIGLVLAVATYFLPGKHYDVVVAFSILGSLGAILYVIYGKDAPDPLLRFSQGAAAPPATMPTTTEAGLPE